MNYRYGVTSFVTNIDRENSYDHNRKISEFSGDEGIEILGTDTVYVPDPNKNSTDKGELITTVTYRKRLLML